MQTTQKLQNLIFSGQPENLELAKALAQSTAHPFAGFLAAFNAPVAARQANWDGFEAHELLQSWGESRRITLRESRQPLEVPVWLELFAGLGMDISLHGKGFTHLERLHGLQNLNQLMLVSALKKHFALDVALLPTLDTLYLEGSGSLEILGESPALAGLRRLELHGSGQLNVHKILTQTTAVEILTLRCVGTSTRVLAPLWAEIQALRQLRVWCVWLRTDDGLPSDLSALATLETLMIRVDAGQSVVWPTRWPPRLQKVSIIGAEGLVRLPESLYEVQTLEELVVYQCRDFEEIPTLERFPALQSLNLEKIKIKGKAKNSDGRPNREALQARYPQVRVGWL